MSIALKRNRPGILVLSIVILATGITVAILKKAYTPKVKENDFIYVNSSRISSELFVNGIVIARRSINLSPLTPGRLDQLFIKEGDQVSENQLIARMKNDDLSSSIDQLESRLISSKADLMEANSRFTRYTKLAEAGAVTAELIEQLGANKIRLLGVHKDLEEKLDLAKRQLEDSFIRAPFSGTITKRYAQAGEYVAPATPASNYAGATSNSIAELSNGLEIQAEVPEAKISLLRVGQTVSLESYAFAGKIFTGVIRSISPRALSLQNLVTFPVLITPSKTFSSLKLKPGMEVKVTFKTSDPLPYPSVPLSAIVSKSENLKGVYVLSASNNIKFRAVRLGESSNTSVQVVSGLQAGEKVLVVPPSTIK